MTQYNTLDRSCTVRENLYYHCRYFGFSAGLRRGAGTDELLHAFRLTDRAEGMAVTLSGGLAQRVQIARAIAHRPAMLFLDEPTAGLDPQSRLALWELVARTPRQTGITVLLTTHYMEEADRLSDRVAIIDHGRVLVTGTPAELKRGIGAETVIEVQSSGRGGVPGGRDRGAALGPRSETHGRPDSGSWRTPARGSCPAWSRRPSRYWSPRRRGPRADARDGLHPADRQGAP